MKVSSAFSLFTEDYHHLRQALIRRLNSPREIPEINMKKVRQYQKIHDPPSELELFFKVNSGYW